MSTTTNLNTLVINYLTEAQYEAAVSGGTIDPDQLYLTPATDPITNGIIHGTTSTLTPTQVVQALADGYNVELSYTDATYGAGKAYSFNYSESMHEVVANVIFLYNSSWICCEIHGNTISNTWTFVATELETKGGETFEIQFDRTSGRSTSEGMEYDMLTSFGDAYDAAVSGKLFYTITDGGEGIIYYPNVYYAEDESVYGNSAEVTIIKSGEYAGVELFVSSFEIFDTGQGTSKFIMRDCTVPFKSQVPTYTAGNGISISNGVISLDLSQAEGGRY